jgi:hypothetical protein
MQESGEIHAQAVLSQLNSRRYSLNRSLDGTQILSGRCGHDENLLGLLGIEPRLAYRAACSPAAIPAELSRKHNNINGSNNAVVFPERNYRAVKPYWRLSQLKLLYAHNLYSSWRL